MKPAKKCQKLQFFKLPLEAGCKPNVINMFPNSQIPASCYEQVQFMYEHWFLKGQGP